LEQRLAFLEGQEARARAAAAKVQEAAEEQERK